MISNIQISHITTSRATITWSTDSPTTSKILYGLTTNYAQEREETPLITEHSIRLSGLLKNKIYHFQVTAQDQYGESSTSEDESFSTILEEPFIVLEENIIAADERVRTGWQKLITVLPDALSPQLDVMSGYLHSVRKKMQADKKHADIIDIEATVTTDAAGGKDDSLTPKKKGG